MGAFPFAPIASPEEPESVPSRRLDVLVAEDDPGALRGLVASIRALGHECRGASDGMEALRMLEDRPADVVISDWEMPGATGAELCRRIRSAKNVPYTYFVLMTGHHDREHLFEGMGAGADDYQKKPIDLDELEARLVSAARVVGLHRELEQQTKELRRGRSVLWRDSRTDALTSAGNRRRMVEELAVAYARAVRYQRPASIALFDIDHFKELNDAYGHLAGDEALVRVSSTIRSTIRGADALFRYGGEEFLVLLPEQGRADAALAAERIRGVIEALHLDQPRRGPLTVSAGVAELDPAVDKNVDHWIGRADSALYHAKTHGRNRVATDPPLEEPLHAQRVDAEVALTGERRPS